MSAENVDRAERAYAAFNEGDVPSVVEHFDPDIAWSASDVFFDEPRAYRGRSEWTEAFLRELMELFEDYRADPEEIIDADDHLVAIVRVGGHGRSSGAMVTARVAHVIEFRDGRISSFTEFKDVDEALRAAGMSE
ncbi:MAG: nuclear transport factor 2 family protein [Solirubrobacterales bacterium]|nr:nuclear transport factor 2 family protein [Solirubrobacterales bacterium]